MKGIISEQEELKNSYNVFELVETTSYNQEHDTVSPVYSLPEEDLTHEFMPEDQANETEMHTGKEIQGKDNDLVESVNESNLNDNVNHLVVNEMQRCLSKLSLQVTQDSKIAYDVDEQNYSQSILGNNFLHDEDTQINRLADSQNKQTIDESSNYFKELHQISFPTFKPSIDTDCYESTSRLEHGLAPLTAQPHNTKDILTIDRWNSHLSNTKATYNKVISSVIKLDKNANSEIKPQIKNKRGRKKKATLNLDPISIHEEFRSKQKKKPKSKTSITKLVTSPTFEARSANKRTYTSKTNVKKKLLQAPSPNVHRTIENLYNKDVENDLSWIENIRYVRESRSDEFDPKLSYLNDSFWHNFELPGDWDDQDFVC